MKVSFTCKNNCYMQGEHSEKGRWKDIYNYEINQNMPLEEILRFAGIKDTEVTETEASKLSSSIKSDTQREPSVLDKAKSTCTELGFTLGTEKHGECVLKMMDY